VCSSDLLSLHRKLNEFSVDNQYVRNKRVWQLYDHNGRAVRSNRVNQTVNHHYSWLEWPDSITSQHSIAWQWNVKIRYLLAAIRLIACGLTHYRPSWPLVLYRETPTFPRKPIYSSQSDFARETSVAYNAHNKDQITGGATSRCVVSLLSLECGCHSLCCFILWFLVLAWNSCERPMAQMRIYRHAFAWFELFLILTEKQTGAWQRIA